ncbi:hypothetical protein [Enterobacter roggenkampii]|uniref:hypothetical protein n=1 Tax=Enterobacter roggenkampii TaxID=1812935 RepID=UPI00321A73B1
MSFTGFGGGWSDGRHSGGDSSGSIGGGSIKWDPNKPNGSITGSNGITYETKGQWVTDRSGSGNGGNGGNSGNSSSSVSQAAQQAAAEAARIAEQQRQQRIAAENAKRQSLQQQLGSTNSADATRALLSQINSLGTEANNAAALNKSLLDAANKRLGLQVQTQSNSAIGAAQAARNAASSVTSTGANTAAYSGKISQAIGTAVSPADQAANAAEAKRMGGYNLTSTAGRVANVAKSALGGLAVGGPVGGLLGTAASVYSNFISDRQSASSRTLTEGTAAPKAGVADVLAGMTTGAIKGALLGPLGMMAGAVWGGATASGTAPTAEDLKGSSPLTNGQTSNPSSAGPGQTLVNGVRVGNGGNNANGYRPGSLTPVFSNPTYNTPQTTAPDASANSSSSGGSSFGSFISDLRRRQVDNLLYTGAGWNQTSGTSLLGRVGATQGAVGGLSGQIISQYGGGRSLLGGAWSW